MITLPDLIALNNKPRKPVGASARQHSFLFTKQNSVILHSATHRETEVHSSTASYTVFPRNGCHYQRKNQYSRDVYFTAQYWLRQGEAEAQAFISAVFDGGDIDNAERQAFQASRPEWDVTRVPGTGRDHSRGNLVARRKSGSAVESVSAYTWRHLHARVV